MVYAGFALGCFLMVWGRYKRDLPFEDFLGLFCLGIVLFLLWVRTEHRSEKYIFENTTDGGVVRFKSYGAKTRFHMKNFYMSFVGGLGAGLMVVGGFYVYQHWQGAFDHAFYRSCEFVAKLFGLKLPPER